MTTRSNLRDGFDLIENALVTLREMSRALAAGRATSPPQLERIIGFLETADDGHHAREVAALVPRTQPSSGGQTRTLLAVMRHNVARMADGSGVERRQFFHAARAYLTIRKAQLDDERRSSLLPTRSHQASA